MVASVRDGEVPYQSLTIILAAGETRLVSGTLRYLQLRSATDSTKVQISFNGSSFYVLPTGEQLADFEADGVWFKNTDVAPNTVVFVTGMAKLNSTRVIIDSSSTLPVSISGTVASSIVDGGDAAMGAKADAAAGTDTGTFSLISLFKRLLSKLPTIGQQAVASSMSVTLATSHPTITVTGTPGAGFGASTLHHAISAATTNATSVKASAGAINSLHVCNANAAVRYFKLYNKASAPTVGTDTPVMTVLVPPNGSIALDLGAYGVRLGTGIAYALTTGIAVADTGAVGLSDMSVHISYT